MSTRLLGIIAIVQQAIRDLDLHEAQTKESPAVLTMVREKKRGGDVAQFKAENERFKFTHKKKYSRGKKRK